MKVTLTPLLPSRLLLSIAGACFLSAHAADEPGLTEMEGAVRTWQTADKLPSDEVAAIIQTSDRFLWVGTSAGLVRFDGVKFTRVALTTSSNHPPISITALCEDKDGHLWIGTQQDGLFELAQGKVSHFKKTAGLLDGNVTSLAADNSGRVWIGTKSGLNVAQRK